MISCRAETRRPKNSKITTGMVSKGKRMIWVFDTFCATAMMARPAPMEVMMAPNSSSSGPLLRSLRNAPNSIKTDSSPLPNIASKKPAHSGQPPSTEYSAMNAPVIKTAPWARFNTWWMPKTRVNPMANKAYTPPTISPFRSCWMIILISRSGWALRQSARRCG